MKKKETNNITQVNLKTVKGEAKPSMLLSTRQQNINIVLGKLKLSGFDVSDALITFNEEVLTINVCELLL
jgi:hypothetical protein